MRIRPLKFSDIPLLKDFAPTDWGSNISQVFFSHFGRTYFYPIVAENNGTIVGCANGLINEETGWLSNIIVQPEYRGQGIGSALSAHLVEYLQSRGCASQTLVATKMGEQIYTKLGFITRSTYTFLHRDRKLFGRHLPLNLLRRGNRIYGILRSFTRKLVPLRSVLYIRQAEARDFEAMRVLDREITGENRKVFLEQYLAEGWVYQASVEEPVSGFFLPSLGSIMARDSRAGLGLLQFNLSNITYAVPTTNKQALDFLIRSGFYIQSVMPRMTLGSDLEWRPEGIYKRGPAYCG